MRHKTEGFAWLDQARLARQHSDRVDEAEALRRSVAHLALAEIEGEALRGRAAASHRLADLLAEDGIWPEAMQAYQEAADAYGLLPNYGSEAAECARRIRDGVRALRSRPYDRLYLLTARYEREIRSLEVQADTEKERGDRAFHIAEILHRRERHLEAVSRYEEALGLYAQAVETELEQAHCCKKLGDLFFGPLEDDVRAFSCYRRAERLFDLMEFLPELDERSRYECTRRIRDLATDLSDIRG